MGLEVKSPIKHPDLWAEEIGRLFGLRAVILFRIEGVESLLHGHWSAGGDWRTCWRAAQDLSRQLRGQHSFPALLRGDDIVGGQGGGWAVAPIALVGGRGYLAIQGAGGSENVLTQFAVAAGRIWDAEYRADRIEARADHLYNGLLQFQALIQSARDMVAQPDIQAAMDIIVKTACQLLNADVAHVLLPAVNSKRYARVAYTHGTRQADYRNVMLPLDEGIVGLTYRLGTVVTSTRLLQDHRRNESYDHLLIQEAISSGMCAPMFAQGQWVGMLYICTRDTRRFLKQEADLLQILASISALSLKNLDLTRMIEEAARARQQEASALARVLVEQRRLADLVLQGRGVGAVVETLSEVIAGEVLLEDDKFQPLAFAPASLSERLPDVSLSRLQHSTIVRDLAKSLKPAELAVTLDGERRQRLIYPVVADGRMISYLSVLIPRREFTEFELVIIEQSALLLSFEAVKALAVGAVEQKLGSELGSRLLRGVQTVDSYLVYRASQHRYNINGSHRVAVLRIAARPGEAGADDEGNGVLGSRGATLTELLHRRIAGMGLGALVTLWEGDLVILISEGQSGSGRLGAGRGTGNGTKAIRDLLDEVIEALPGTDVSVGCSTAVGSVADIPGAYEEARLAAEIGWKLGMPNRVISYEEMGVLRLIARAPSSEDIQSFLNHTIGPVLEYDARNKTNLIPTLYRYLFSGLTYKDAADRLGIHPNTLKYRLRRVEELADINLDDPEDVLSVQMALKILLLTRREQYPSWPSFDS